MRLEFDLERARRGALVAATIAVVLVAVLFIASCSAPAPSCSAGVMLLGPLPLPYVDCGVSSEPEEDDDLDV